jgi:hypothetical protein
LSIILGENRNVGEGILSTILRFWKVVAGILVIKLYSDGKVGENIFWGIKPHFTLNVFFIIYS